MLISVVNFFESVVNSLDTNEGLPEMQENNTGSNVADSQADYWLSQIIPCFRKGENYITSNRGGKQNQNETLGLV